MSSRPHHDLSDAHLDAALRAIAGSGEPRRNLHPRVMAAIQAAEGPVRDRSWRDVARDGFGWQILGRLTLGIACVVLLAVTIAVWSGARGDRVRLNTAVNNRSAGAGANPRVAIPRTTAPHGIELPRGMGPVSREHRATHPAGVAPVAGTRMTGPVEPWRTTLPLLDRPEPIDVERIDEPQMLVATLHIDRLSIDTLELSPLDHSDEE